MGLTAADLYALLDAFEASTWQEMTVEVGEDRLHVSRRTGPAPIRTPAPTPAAAPAAGTTGTAQATEPTTTTHAPPDGSNGAVTSAAATGVPVTAPSVGVFWRSPSPGAPPFIDVGSPVSPDDTVGILEIMKLMKPIAAGVAGTVTAVLVENGAPVEFGQALLLVEPEA
jgi:acetyl-CoA carboxylase biotin carboxyl carrier protein